MSHRDRSVADHRIQKAAYQQVIRKRAVNPMVPNLF